MLNPRCPETGDLMERDSKPITLTYKGHSTTFDMPGWYCPTCDEGIHNGDDMKISDRALNRLKALAEGLLSPEEIRRIRKKLRITQVAAGEMIGGGPRAFQKYEMGDLLPSRAITSALLLLDHAPQNLQLLRKANAGQAERNSPRGPLPNLNTVGSKLSRAKIRSERH